MNHHNEMIEVTREAIVPSVDIIIRAIPTVSSTVSKLLAQYEDQTRHGLVPGKDLPRNVPGHYNNQCKTRNKMAQ